jgi:hypothetical protein
MAARRGCGGEELVVVMGIYNPDMIHQVNVSRQPPGSRPCNNPEQPAGPELRPGPAAVTLETLVES